jgi:type II secretory pathway pseudopilin PulG
MPRRRDGFTLLEVVLSAGLTIVLLAALWGLISTYVRAFDKAEQKTQTAQVARTILAQVAEDLRSAAGLASQKTSSARIAIAGQDAPAPIAQVSGSAPASPSGALQPPTAPPSASAPPTIQAEGQQTPPPAPTSVGSLGRSGTSGSASSPAGGSTALDIPLTIARRAGLFGSRNSLRIDVVRTLAVDDRQVDIEEIEQVGEPMGQRDRAPELLTVTYGFHDPRDVDPADTLASTGLVRREVPTSGVRPQMRGSSDGTDEIGADLVDSALGQGESPSVDTSGSPREDAVQLSDTLLLAPEVTRLEFEYFDGQEWFDEWDSMARGGLPSAVAIALDVELDEPRRIRESPAAEKTAELEISRPEEVPPAFRLVVWLATANASGGAGPSGIEPEPDTNRPQSAIGASASLRSGGLP